MLIDILRAYGLIFLAELGDKSQLLAMTLATKYKRRTVMVGVFIGILANHAIAVGLGSFIGNVLDPQYIGWVIGLVFVLFGLITLLDQPHQTPIKSYSLPPVITIALLFFIGELGDKTQFATVALSIESASPWMLLFGTVGAMMTTSILAIYLGEWLGQKFPETTIKLISAGIFTLYGIIRLSPSLPSPLLRILLFALVIILYGLLAYRYTKQSKETLSAFKQAAHHLQEFYHHFESSLDVICLTETVCGPCQKQGCLVGHVKYLVEEGKAGRPVSLSHLRSKTMRDVDKDRVKRALNIVIEELQDHWTDSAFTTLHHIRQALEFMMYRKTLRSPSYEAYQSDTQLIQQKQ